MIDEALQGRAPGPERDDVFVLGSRSSIRSDRCAWHDRPRSAVVGKIEQATNHLWTEGESADIIAHAAGVAEEWQGVMTIFADFRGCVLIRLWTRWCRPAFPGPVADALVFATIANESLSGMADVRAAARRTALLQPPSETTLGPDDDCMRRWRLRVTRVPLIIRFTSSSSQPLWCGCYENVVAAVVTTRYCATGCSGCRRSIDNLLDQMT